MVGAAIARRMRSGVFVGPGICRKWRPRRIIGPHPTANGSPWRNRSARAGHERATALSRQPAPGWREGLAEGVERLAPQRTPLFHHGGVRQLAVGGDDRDLVSCFWVHVQLHRGVGPFVAEAALSIGAYHDAFGRGAVDG